MRPSSVSASPKEELSTVVVELLVVKRLFVWIAESSEQEPEPPNHLLFRLALYICRCRPFPGFLLRRSMAGASLIETGQPFFAWDLLTVAHLLHPELFSTTKVMCDIVPDGVGQGRIIRAGSEYFASVYVCLWIVQVGVRMHMRVRVMDCPCLFRTVCLAVSGLYRLSARLPL